MGFSIMEQQMSSLLAKLEQATGHPSCDTCHYPRRRCVCASRGSTLSPHENWSSGTSTSNVLNQEYPLPTRGTTTVSVSQSRAPANMVVAPPQGVVSPIWRQPTLEVQGTTHHPHLGGSVNYASASLPPTTIRQPGPGSSQCPPQGPPMMETPAVQTPKPRPSTPYHQQVFMRHTNPLAYLQAAGRGQGVPRTTAPSQVSTPGAPQSHGNISIGWGRGVLSQYGGTEPSPSGPSPGEDQVQLTLQRIALRAPLSGELLDPEGSTRNLLTNPILRGSHPCVRVRDGGRMRIECMPISWLSPTPVSLQKRRTSSLHQCWITCGAVELGGTGSRRTTQWSLADS